MPHLALCRPSGEPLLSAAQGRLTFEAPQRRVVGVRCGLEVLVVPAAVPAALLDAADRDPDLGAGGDEDVAVHRTVLLGADDLLALVEQERPVGRVADEQPVDGGALVELLDERAVLDGIGERAVLEQRRGAEDREDGERADDLRLAEGELGGERVHAGWVGVTPRHLTPTRFL